MKDLISKSLKMRTQFIGLRKRIKNMNMYKIPFIFAIFIFLVVGCSSEEICIESDLVLINTKIYTANPEEPDEAFAIKNGKFSFMAQILRQKTLTV